MSADTTTAGPVVLVADDDPTLVLLLEHILEGMGRTFETADDGAEAWRAWQQSRHPLVLLDIEMPQMDGLEVCRRIREADNDRATFIVIVTGRDRATDLEAALAAGADDYVTKPTTGPRLLARLRIAERRMADDAARRRAEDELRKSRWLAGIAETIVALQHEINNPLASLLATADLLLLEEDKPGEHAQQLQVIVEQGRRISEILRRIGELRDPRSVPYAGGATMLDLGKPPE